MEIDGRELIDFEFRWKMGYYKESPKAVMDEIVNDILRILADEDEQLDEEYENRIDDLEAHIEILNDTIDTLEDENDLLKMKLMKLMKFEGKV